MGQGAQSERELLCCGMGGGETKKWTVNWMQDLLTAFLPASYVFFCYCCFECGWLLPTALLSAAAAAYTYEQMLLLLQLQLQVLQLSAAAVVRAADFSTRRMQASSLARTFLLARSSMRSRSRWRWALAAAR